MRLCRRPSRTRIKDLFQTAFPADIKELLEPRSQGSGALRRTTMFRVSWGPSGDPEHCPKQRCFAKTWRSLAADSQRPNRPCISSLALMCAAVGGLYKNPPPQESCSSSGNLEKMNTSLCSGRESNGLCSFVIFSVGSVKQQKALQRKLPGISLSRTLMTIWR